MGALDEPQSSDPVDPLGDIFATSLFPRTFLDPTTSGTPTLADDDLESIHNAMRSVVLKSSVKHFEQAKAICQGGSDLMNSQFVRSLGGLDKHVALPGRRKEKAQERRPGLDRKRAQFSLKPRESQPPVTVELNVDIDQLEDPEEYFNAFQKLENAKKELQRQRGESVTELVDRRTSRTERRRRPAILGKSVSYKHSSMIGDETFLASQETLDQGNTVSENRSSQPDMNDADAILQEKELTSSVSKTESRVNELLSKFISEKSENLDEEGVITFLQESLQIKHTELDKICIPEFHDVSKDDLMDFKEQLPRRRKTLFDLSNLVKGIRSKTPTKHKQVAKSPANSLDTPTPPKSPFAAISSLKRKMFESTTVRDPFSTNELSAGRNCSSVENTNRQEGQHTPKESLGPGELTSPIAETSDRTVGADLNKNVKEDLGNSSKNSTSHFVESCLSGDDSDERNCSGNINEKVLGDKATGVNSDTYDQANEAPEVNHDEENTMPQLSSPGNVNFVNSSMPYNGTDADGPNEMVEDTSGNASAGVDLEYTTVGEFDTNQNEKDKLSSAPVLSVVEDGPYETAHAIPDLVENVHNLAGVSSSEPISTERSTHGGCEEGIPSSGQTLRGPSKESLTEQSPRLGRGKRTRSSKENLLDPSKESLTEQSPCLGRGKRTRSSKENPLDPSRVSSSGQITSEQSPRGARKKKTISSRKSLLDPSQVSLNEQNMQEQLPLGGLSKRTLCSQQNLQDPTRGVSMNENITSEQSPHGGRKRRKLSSRQSLGGAGTHWVSGVRRSQRHKMRPLEYWKGERFLYGRVHESLTTVIGVKYVSPAKGKGTGSLRVKSYVSDEYKELVELAALH